MPKWIVFDYGEVLSRRTQSLPTLAEVLGVAVEDFVAAYDAERTEYDRGCGDTAYWTAVGRRLGVDVDESLVRELTTLDIDGWLETDPEAIALVTRLYEDGMPLALLSNAPSSFGRAVENQPWSAAFRHMVFSGDLLMAKPDAEIWRALLRTIGAEPGECLFFDDREENVLAAREAGLRAEKWSGAGTARDALDQLGLPAVS